MQCNKMFKNTEEIDVEYFGKRTHDLKIEWKVIGGEWKR